MDKPAWKNLSESHTARIQPANKILLVNLGREHDDTRAVKAALEKRGFEVDIIDLKKNNFSCMDFSRVAAVDLRNSRGWQRHFDFFNEQLAELEEKISATGRDIPVINPSDMFHWVASKEYLKEMENKGIPVVKTAFLRRGDQNWPDIQAMINENPDKRIVLKPAKGARADDIIFITKTGEDKFQVTCPKPRTKASTAHVITFTKENLHYFLMGYRAKKEVEEEELEKQNREFYRGNKSYERSLLETQNQPAILIQQYHRGDEVSAVFIGDETHFVDRSRDSANMVAHEDFGGENVSSSSPNFMAVKLAKSVRNALPKDLRNTPYLRVDMLQDDNNPPVLLEIEAGSARLFLNETGRVDEYAQMVENQVRQARLKTKLLQDKYSNRGFTGTH